MEIVIWGTRGSIASPGPETVRYGGNTTCVEIRNGDDFVLVDAGTGIRPCGDNILKERGMQNDIPLFITHTHWDHIQGFPFFVPIFIPGNRIRIFGPHNHTRPFPEVLAGQMQYSYFPVNFAQLQAEMEYGTLHDLEEVQFGSIKVISKYVNHPVPTLAYRFESADKAIVFMTDCEPYQDILFNGVCPSEDEREEFEEVQAAVAQQNQALVDFAKDARILVMDAQYTRAEYEDGKTGWGHTSMEEAVALGEKAGVRDVLFFHHDPGRTDNDLDRIIGGLETKMSQKPTSSVKKLGGAREGHEFKA